MVTSRRIDEQLVERVIKPSAHQMVYDRYGVILEYFPDRNVATVLMADPESDYEGIILENVMCPTHVGVQVQDPEPGRLAWVVFKKGSEEGYPIITSFFNPYYDRFDHAKHNNALNPTPRYLYEL